MSPGLWHDLAMFGTGWFCCRLGNLLLNRPEATAKQLMRNIMVLLLFALAAMA